jgi:hypothetical protein
MDYQAVIVVAIIAVAFLYVAMTFLRKTKAFSPKATCDEDCGCGSKDKTPKAAH